MVSRVGGPARTGATGWIEGFPCKPRHLPGIARYQELPGQSKAHLFVQTEQNM
jgi:hypothetical protein